MSESKSNTVVEKLILFAVFLVFAGIVVAFALKWNYVGEDKSSQDVISLQYITSSKAETVSVDGGQENASKATPSVTQNINTATLEELDSLPDIGPAKAKAIIEYRETESEFIEIEDIKKVSGIGEKTFEKLKNHITVK